MRALKSLLPLADTMEQDVITRSLTKLVEEKRTLGVQHWGSVRKR